MFPDPAVETGRLRYRTLHDLRLTEWLAWTDADAVIATRPLLNGYLARHGSDRYLRIGQEHLTLASHEPGLRADQNSCLPHLDAFVTLTEADAAAYRTAVPEAADRVHAVPPGSPDLGLTPSLRTSRTIVAAGRLVPGKRYDRLVDAFAKLLPEHPGWTLRIYGRGPEHAALRRRIDRLGLYDDVLLMGAVTPMEPEWAKAAIAAVSSDTEPYGHGILEAMRAGVPVVATDAPHGPARLVAHGVTGLLVPLTGGSDAFAAALGRLMDDQETRDRFGRTARVHAAAHSTEAAAKAYERILDDVHARRTRERAELDALTPAPARPPAPPPASPRPTAPRTRAAPAPRGSPRAPAPRRRRSSPPRARSRYAPRRPSPARTHSSSRSATTPPPAKCASRSPTPAPRCSAAPRTASTRAAGTRTSSRAPPAAGCAQVSSSRARCWGCRRWRTGRASPTGFLTARRTAISRYGPGGDPRTPRSSPWRPVSPGSSSPHSSTASSAPCRAARWSASRPARRAARASCSPRATRAADASASGCPTLCRSPGTAPRRTCGTSHCSPSRASPPSPSAGYWATSSTARGSPCCRTRRWSTPRAARRAYGRSSTYGAISRSSCATTATGPPGCPRTEPAGHVLPDHGGDAGERGAPPRIVPGRSVRRWEEAAPHSTPAPHEGTP
nr:glycosyltransferase [Streptomyces sp. SID4926]